MKTTMRWICGVVLTILISTALTSSPAAAAVDKTPPQLTLPPYAQFVQGAMLGDDFWMDEDASFNSAPMTIGWKATDASGICGYDLWEERAYEDPTLVLSRTRQASYVGFASDYTNQFGSGGGGWLKSWTVIAYDCAGNSVSKTARVRPSIIQEDGRSSADLWATIAYTGKWADSSCTCYLGAGSKKSTARNARAVITFTSAANATVALAMERSPSRGKFTLLVDGVKRGTIDTFARTNQHKVIVWSGRIASAGTHVIEVVNQATAGRPRIDLDAVLRNG